MSDCLVHETKNKVVRSIFGNHPLGKIFQILQIKRACLINHLWEFVAFQTVSTRHDKYEELNQAAEWFLKRLREIGIVAFEEKMGFIILPKTFRTVRMPKSIIAVHTPSPGKPTILIYGRLDIDDASVDEGWLSEPFLLFERDEYLYGRGVSSGKGPLICWLHAISSFKDSNTHLPVNVVFVIESMGTNNHLGLEDLLKNRISFFREVSCVCIADRRWLTKDTPCLVYGTRGLLYYTLEVECANRDLSSCEHGGTLFEAMPDLFYLLSSLVNIENNILVGDISTHYDIDPTALQNSKFNPWQLAVNLQIKELPNGGKKTTTLGSNWAMPHISIHGIEGGHAKSDICFVIPHKVSAKFSIALAPNQNPKEVSFALQKHLGEVWTARDSPNRMLLCEKASIPAWTSKCNGPEYKAATRAAYDVYNKLPSIIRDGGAMLVPTIFERVLGKNVIVIPIADNDDCRGPTNERISIKHFTKGSQMLAAFIYEYGQRHKQSIIAEDFFPKA